MKYIMFEVKDGENTLKIPFLFPNSQDLIHKYIAGNIASYLRSHFKSQKPVSAGFYNTNDGAYGESESLNLKANRDEDTSIIDRFLNSSE